jgi:hypothetical protein
MLMTKHSKKKNLPSAGIAQQHGHPSADGRKGTKPNRKKRPRSKSDGSTGKAANEESTPSQPKIGGPTDIIPSVVQWLESRKKPVPPALTAGDPPSNAEVVLRLLPGLRERERRALMRRIEKFQRSGGAVDAGQTRALEGSDGKYECGESEGDEREIAVRSDDWPVTVEFSNDYRWD